MQCPVCSSTRLSPLTEAGPYNTSFRASFQVEGKRLTTQITQGRICGDCGYVMLYLNPTDLRELQKVWGGLMPNQR